MTQHGKIVDANPEAGASTQLEVLPNYYVSTDMPLHARIEVLKMVSSYVCAETVLVNKFLNKPLPVKGCLVNMQALEKPDPKTGETEYKQVLLKLVDDTVIRFGSGAATRFVERYLIPLMGRGDWKNGETLTVLIVQVPTDAGHTYSFRVV